MLRIIPVVFLVVALGAAFLVEGVVKPNSSSFSSLTSGIVDPIKLRGKIVLAKLNRAMTPERAFDFADYTPDAPDGWQKRPYHISDELLFTGIAPWGEDIVDPDILVLQKSLAQIQSRGNENARDLYWTAGSAMSVDIQFVKNSLFGGLRSMPSGKKAPVPVFAKIDGLDYVIKPGEPEAKYREFKAILGKRLQITVVANASNEDILALIQSIDATGLLQLLADPEAPKNNAVQPSEAVADPEQEMPAETEAIAALPPVVAPTPKPVVKPISGFKLTGSRPTSSSTFGRGGCRSSSVGKFCKVASN